MSTFRSLQPSRAEIPTFPPPNVSDLDLEGLNPDDDLHLGEEGEDEGGEEDSAHQPCTAQQSSGIVPIA
jgi:hypothetical protein